MLNESQAKKAIEDALPEVKVQAWVRYRDVYLFRVVFPSKLEANYDPFFSVDTVTGEVRDFSVMTDGDISEISRLFANANNTG